MAGRLSRGEVILDVDDGMKGRSAVNLHNAVTVSQEHLGKSVTSLSAVRMPEVCVALRFSPMPLDFARNSIYL